MKKQLQVWALSASMYITFAPDHQPCLWQLHLTSSHICKPVSTSMHFWYTCIGPAFIYVIAISNHLYCCLHLQQTSIVVMVVTIAPDQKACTNKQSWGYQTSAARSYLTLGCFSCWHKWTVALNKLYVYINFIHPSSWFLRILIQKRLLLWTNTLSQSFQWYNPFSIPWHLLVHFLKEC